MHCGIGIDEFFELSWYEFYLLTERRRSIEEEKKLKQEWEWVRLSHLLSLVSNVAGNKTKPESFYIPSWHSGEVEGIKDTRTNEEVNAKFPKTINGK